MEHLAGLLKLLFERGSWLAGVAIVGLSLAVARAYGQFADADKQTVDLVYLISAICFAVLAVGGALTLIQRIWRNWSANDERRKLEESAVRNLPNLPPEYLRILGWLFVRDKKEVAEEYSIAKLETLAEQGYLIKEFPDKYYSIRHYKFTPAVWAAMEARYQREKLKPLLREEIPPWHPESWRV